MYLVIVESPNKKSTIKKYLNSVDKSVVSELISDATFDDKEKEIFNIGASVGHVRDIAKDGKYNLGIDIESGLFTPNWEILPGKDKVINDLKKLAKKADKVFLATDPDREGEAIAWHLAQVLDLDLNEANRLEFHEITKYAILDSFKNVRPINMNLYHAQETRRIMDRIIGFRLSYIVNNQIGCLTAGRVQSVVLKFVFENEEKIKNFIPQDYFNIYAELEAKNGEKVNAYYVDEKNQKIDIYDKDEISKTLENLGTNFDFIECVNEDKKLSSPAPFTMSKLIQTASSKLFYKTEVVASALKLLFENGYITYPRTDSIRLAPEFINRAKAFIKEKFGENYVGVAKVQSNKSNVADAHEALRPTDLNMTPDAFAAQSKSKAAANIYKLIYDRTIKSLMTPTTEIHKTYIFNNNGYRFAYKTAQTTFDGYKKYDNEGFLKETLLDTSKSLVSKNINEEKLTTKPEPRYTEGTLVKKMEETGIGRPSTYASTIKTLLDSGYVHEEKNQIFITNQGIKLSKYLIKNFPNTIKTEYTAELEEKLDLIEQGERSELETLKLCNDNFLEEFEHMLKNPDMILPEKTGESCPICGAPLVHIEKGKMDFIGCSNYPSCKYVQPEYTGTNCPKCGKPLVYKKGAYGKFIACSGFPKCNYHEYPKSSFTKKKFIKK